MFSGKAKATREQRVAFVSVVWEKRRTTKSALNPPRHPPVVRIPWQEVEGEYRSKQDEYVVVLPQGWMRANRQDFTLVTRDGALLQNILIIRHKIGEPLPLSKKALSEQMTIQEVADVLFESFQADQDVLECELLEKRPSSLGGIAGLRIDFTYKNTDELAMRSVAYGCIYESWLYVMRYTAASRYYFERDLPVFVKAVETFRVL